ncbi:hypothetical protein CFOL_v3_22822, partial [Cephalotus follicularis]
FFRTSVKCDIVDNNMTETFNRWILDARIKSIVQMLQDIRRQVMERMPTKRDAIQGWRGEFGPRINQKLKESKKYCINYSVLWNGEARYEIKDNITNGGYVVNLSHGQCSCRSW